MAGCASVGSAAATGATGSSARARIDPCTVALASDCTSTSPPLGPLASITLVGASSTDCLPRRVTRPFSPNTAEFAWMVPLLRTRPP